jgi:hypothetical protein
VVETKILTTAQGSFKCSVLSNFYFEFLGEKEKSFLQEPLENPATLPTPSAFLST